MTSGARPEVEQRPKVESRIRGFLARWHLPLVLVLALLVRLPGLASRPLWYDEAFAVLFSAEGPAAMLRGTLEVEGGMAADVHPIFYYTLLWGWQNLVGNSPAAVRALSLILGIATVACGYGLSRSLFGRRTAAATAALLALSPFQVHYSQETRMYALLALVLTAATWVFLRALRSGQARDYAAFGVLAACAMYAHNLAFTYLVPLSLMPILQRRWRDALRTLAAGLGALVLYLPWLIQVPMQLARVRTAYWVEQPGAAALVRTLLVYVGGLPVEEWALPIVLACAILVTVIGMWGLVRNSGAPAGERVSGMWMLYLATAPVGVMFLVSLLQPVYLERALLPSGTIFLLWLGWALSGAGLARTFRLTGAGALLLAFVLGLAGFFSYRGFPYAPFDELTAYLRAHREPSEVILHSNKISAIPAVYYEPGLVQEYLADPPNSGSDTLARATQEVLGLLAEPDAAGAVGEAEGVWFVIFPREIEDYLALGLPGHPALAWLEARYSVERIEEFGELRAYHFIRPERVQE
ncbi:MAG TPA: glycosyltransferase family 39 protein [Anaerolineales bacterium]|nr:glycosyltransferase family 39 protein [Anaerolineales bacterium]